METTRADAGRWAAGMICFQTVRQSAFDNVDTSADPGAPEEAFFAAIIDSFRETARFLDQRSPEITAKIQAAGISLRLFVDVRMDDNQMELEFPPGILAACCRHRLKLYVISNDI